MPALGGPSSTIFHSSGEKAAFAVIRSSFPIGAKLGTIYARRRNARSRSSPGLEPTDTSPGRQMCSSPPGPPGWDQSIAGLTFTTARCEPLRTDGLYSVVRHPPMPFLLAAWLVAHLRIDHRRPAHPA